MRDFNTFDEIQHKPLRAYNRAAYFSNLREDSGVVVANDYLSQFGMNDRLDIARILAGINKLGIKKVQELVTKGVVFEENMTDEEAAAKAEKEAFND